MKKTFFLFFTCINILAVSAQNSAGGVEFSNSVNIEGQKLIFNGAGVRSKYFMKLYSVALYLESKSTDAGAVINSNKPMAMKLHILSSLITSEKMIEAVDEGFKKATNGNTAAIASEIKKFKSYFSGSINKDDVFDITFIPGKGALVYKNGVQKGIIEGADFKEAVFGIWLSDTPVDQDLKSAMLGQK